jgi:hypothetical protein
MEYRLRLFSSTKGNRPGKGNKLVPIFVTPWDRDTYHSIDRKTKSEIQSLILEAIDQVGELGRLDEQRLLLDTWNRDVKAATKPTYLNFYQECVVALEDASQRGMYKERTCV